MAKTKREDKTYTTEMSGTYINSEGEISHQKSRYSTSRVAQRVASDNPRDFRALIARGDDATTSLTGRQYLLRRAAYTEVRIVDPDPRPGKVDNQWLITGRPHSPSFVPTAINGTLATTAVGAAQTAFTKQTRKRTQQFAGGVFCGELLETVRMLASPAKSLRKEVTNLIQTVLRKKPRGKKLSPASLRRMVADTWLEWSFGVKPLVQDVNDAATALDRLANGRRNSDLIRVTGDGYAEAYQARGVEDFSLIPGYPGVLRFRYGWNDRCDVRYRGAIRSANPSGEMPLAMQWGVDASSILPTAWELIPWSFMVDYFTNVGDVIDAWSMRFVDFSWLNRTVRNRRVVKQESLMLLLAVDHYGHFTGGKASGSSTDVDRAKANNQFSPPLMLQIPGFPSTKWINMAALLNGIAEVKRR